MTDEQIERRVEKLTDRLDKRFMNGELTQEQYDVEIKQISVWADHQFDLIAE